MSNDLPANAPAPAAFDPLDPPDKLVGLAALPAFQQKVVGVLPVFQPKQKNVAFRANLAPFFKDENGVSIPLSGNVLYRGDFGLPIPITGPMKLADFAPDGGVITLYGGTVGVVARAADGTVTKNTYKLKPGDKFPAIDFVLPNPPG